MNKIRLNLNVFDDQGDVIDSAYCDLDLEEIENIVSKAAQFILYKRDGFTWIKHVGDELEEALVVAGVIKRE